MRQRRDELANNLDYVWDVFDKGGKKASLEAEKNYGKSKKKK